MRTLSLAQVEHFQTIMLNVIDKNACVLETSLDITRYLTSVITPDPYTEFHLKIDILAVSYKICIIPRISSISLGHLGQVILIFSFKLS